MTKKIKFCAVAAACALIAYSPVAMAGFEWTPPPQQNAASAEIPAAPAALPLEPVDAMSVGPITPMMPAAMPQINDMPLQAAPLAPVPTGSSYNVVEGFGSDIPLALALQQIVPEGYACSFDQTVNPALRVSWNGGRPWDQVLNDAIAPFHLSASITGNTIRIHHGGAQAAPATLAMSPAAAPMNLPPQQDDFMLPEPGMNSMPVDGPVHRNASAAPDLAMIGRDSGGYEPSYPRRQPSASSPMPLYLDDNVPAASNTPQALNLDHMPAREPIAGLSDMPAAPPPIEPAATNVPLLPQMPAMEEPAPMPAMPPLYPPPAQQADNRLWQAHNGDSLRLTLADWAHSAGVELVWNAAQPDYIVKTAVNTRGSFPDAVMDVLMSYENEDARPLGSLHPNLSDGRSVLVIESE